MKIPTLFTLAMLTLGAAAAEPEKPPVLEMRLVLDSPTADSEQMTLSQTNQDGWTHNEVVSVHKKVLLDGKAVTAAVAMPSQAPGMYQINLKLSDKGAKQFAEVTSQNIHKRLAIVIEGKLISAPTIREPIMGGQVQITGSFSQQEANRIAKNINDAAGK